MTTEERRWDVARQLDEAHPEWCWANLGTWALGWNRLREAKDIEVCRRDCAANGACWCGKLRGAVQP